MLFPTEKARHPIPDGQNSVPNKIRTEPLYLLKMQMNQSYQPRMHLDRAHCLQTVWQIWTCEGKLQGATTLFILWRVTCERKEALQLTSTMVGPDYTHTLCQPW